MYYWNKKAQGFYLSEQLFDEKIDENDNIVEVVKEGIDLNDFIGITDEEYYQLLTGQYNKHLESSPDTGYPILVDDVVSKRDELTNQLAEIQAWFLSNDWKINKIVTGEWRTTDTRWTSYLRERAIKRQTQDEIISLLEMEEQK